MFFPAKKKPYLPIIKLVLSFLLAVLGAVYFFAGPFFLPETHRALFEGQKKGLSRVLSQFKGYPGLAPSGKPVPGRKKKIPGNVNPVLPDKEAPVKSRPKGR